MTGQTLTGLIALSEDVYRACLKLYPAPYRDAYGPHMLLTFRDCAREAYRSGGVWVLTGLWVATLLDLLKTAAEERLHKGVLDVSKEKVARWGGTAMIITGVLWIVSSSGNFETAYWDEFGGFDMVYEVLTRVWLLSFIPLLIGLVGLTAYMKSSRTLHAGAWLAVAACTVTVLAVLVDALAQIDTWAVWSISIMVMFIGTFIFGIGTAREKPLPRWNRLPPILCVSNGVLIAIGFLGLMPLVPANLDKWPSVISFALMGLGWTLLGYAMLPVRQSELASV